MGMMDALKSAGQAIHGVASGMGTNPEKFRDWSKNEYYDSMKEGYRTAWDSDWGKFMNRLTGHDSTFRDLGDIVNNRGAYKDQSGSWLEKIWLGGSAAADNDWMMRNTVKRPLKPVVGWLGADNATTIGSYFGPGWGAAIGAGTSWLQDDPYDVAIGRTVKGAVSGYVGDYLSGLGSGTDAAYTAGGPEATFYGGDYGYMAGGAAGEAAGGAAGSASGAWDGSYVSADAPAYQSSFADTTPAPSTYTGNYVSSDAANPVGYENFSVTSGGNGVDYGTSGAGGQYDYTPAPESLPVRRSARSTAAPSAGSSAGRSSGSRAALIKTGLGAITNNQQQQALADEEAKRKQAMDFLAKMEKNPNSLYAKDPGLQQMRANRMNDIRAQYASKYGGTEGGAFARDMMAGGAAFDRQAMNDAYNRRMGMVNATAGIPVQKAQYGGTGLGGITQAATQGVGDYYGMERQDTLDNQNQNNFDRWLATQSRG
jgi:hypothetical protein